ncbi:sucrose-specific PTS transporter subunit IIBC [Ligilactobacillus acidipiscis]|uniref:sucrose-specific PTS transporter subunit IIBC n=1 Tax=Ligilactobacillus acidipiscis TaxID=89059 RepID=UPI0023F96892|nr:sucrose-specific PTS transporter subunit IIBC [Ligilactobacillus acidipiscis]WEV57688.1 sucrose-specific PTS transporter subunit IIBC [Ligilactobacillus acidipiscis]
MAKNYKDVAEDLINEIGQDNVISLTHCQTRLRFVVKDHKRIDDKAIENLPDVKGVFYGSGQYQVIFGTGIVNDVYEEIDKQGLVNTIYGKDENSSNDNSSNNDSNKTKTQKFMAMLAGIFIPIIPVIAATGLFLGLKSTFTSPQVLQLFGATPADIPSNITTVISVLTDTVFSFLPALLVWSTFKYFKGTPIIGIVIGLMLVSPILPNAYSVADGSAKAVHLFGVIPVVGSQGSVLTALVAGFIGAKLELFFRKHMPNVLEQILTPFMTMLTTFMIMILGVGPIVHWIENFMLQGVQAVINIPFGIGGFLIGAAYPLMVVIGIHQTMIAIETSLLASTGLNPLIPLEGMYGFANVGVALAIFLRAHSKKAKETSLSAVMSQLFGVSEPTIFGVLIRYNLKPMIVTILVSGLGGAALSLFHVSANTYGLAVVPSYLMYIYNSHSLLVYTVVSLLTVVIAFIATWMFAIPKEILEVDSKPEKKVQASLNMEDLNVYAPVSGKLNSLADVSDPVFSSGMMGQGIAINTDDNQITNVYAPQDGELSVVADTGHAYGITTASGIEILIHLGIDTVSLNGKGFKTEVNKGQKVRKGELLGSFDKSIIEQNKLDPSVLLLITNSKDYSSVEITNNNYVHSGESVLSVQKQKVTVDSTELA